MCDRGSSRPDYHASHSDLGIGSLHLDLFIVVIYFRTLGIFVLLRLGLFIDEFNGGIGMGILGNHISELSSVFSVIIHDQPLFAVRVSPDSRHQDFLHIGQAADACRTGADIRPHVDGAGAGDCIGDRLDCGLFAVGQSQVVTIDPALLSFIFDQDPVSLFSYGFHDIAVFQSADTVRVVSGCRADIQCARRHNIQAVVRLDNRHAHRDCHCMIAGHRIIQGILSIDRTFGILCDLVSLFCIDINVRPILLRRVKGVRFRQQGPFVAPGIIPVPSADASHMNPVFHGSSTLKYRMLARNRIRNILNCDLMDQYGSLPFCIKGHVLFHGFAEVILGFAVGIRVPAFEETSLLRRIFRLRGLISGFYELGFRRRAVSLYVKINRIAKI